MPSTAIPEELLLHQRAVTETISNQFKNGLQMERARHLSVANCFVNIFAGRVTYA